ncbi:response regulator [Ktedonobacter sp. SOSP1-85]|uniref:response regulator n=1 Tax=Ktedonobacter sp. SOSP1-85 TaxID=2778367 RepID=UPI00191559B7|nr:response regulator [Ktedonobacter sp. SOSP1-85]GHO79945.1 response regulator [Ktedonobacter sp. SOSP1-85]
MQHKKTIVHIDDSATIRKLVEIALRREGYVIQSFPDGVEAMRALQQPGAQLPDLVMLDIDLPKMNGYEIARYLRTKPAWKRVPIVMLSRYNGVVDRLKARLAGAQLYLAKPVTTQQLLQTVEEALSQTSSATESEQPQTALGKRG